MMKHAKIHTKTTSGVLSFGGWGVEESFIVRDSQNVVARERRRHFSRYAAPFLPLGRSYEPGRDVIPRRHPG